MIVVAVVATMLAVGVGLKQRKARFERLSSYHIKPAGPLALAPDPKDPRLFFETAKGRWHYDLALKYAEAARHPWLPVSPDPPQPECPPCARRGCEFAR